MQPVILGRRRRHDELLAWTFGCLLHVLVAFEAPGDDVNGIVDWATGNQLTPQSDVVIDMVVQLEHNNDTLAEQLARAHGLTYQGKVGDLAGLYIFGYPQNVTRSRRRRRSAEREFANEPEVVWSEAQQTLRRVKRWTPRGDGEDVEPVRVKRMSGWQIDRFTDPLMKEQWYLGSGAKGGYTMKVREAWVLGYSGEGVAVTILDDGLQRDQPDLSPNYDSSASHDLNGFDHDPTPRNNGWNQHGTRCASLVSSVANNGLCTAGIAFNSSIGGIRMLDGYVTDGIEASAFSHNQQHVDIYSSSWGPEDDGTTFDGPGKLARVALRQGITQGRSGRGNIYVWATGNGNNRGDSCSFDGYLTSIYTVGATAATYNNQHPWYSEKCPSIITTAYSSGHNSLEPAIPAADVPRGCTRGHSGTSASAPMVSAVIALMLQANPNLTWRDVQHILIRTSNPTPLLSNSGWKWNSVRRRVSDLFGYGLVDAEAAVIKSRNWRQVPKQHGCKVVFGINKQAQDLTGRFSRSFGLDIGTECAAVKYLEHVQLIVDMPFVYRRGALEMTLKSPQGTESTMMAERPRDSYSGDLHQSAVWPFMSRQQWGEPATGRWTLTLKNSSGQYNKAKITGVTLVLYGTSTPAQAGDRLLTARRSIRRRRSSGDARP